MITYDQKGSERADIPDAGELPDAFSDKKVTWINAEGPRVAEAVPVIASSFAIHPLTVEDILDTDRRPKAEVFDNYLYISLKSIQSAPAESDGALVFEQISLILTTHAVITFQEIPGDSFDAIRRRIATAAGPIRKSGADFLAYSLIDALVDEYFLAAESISDAVGLLEEQAVNDLEDSFITRAQDVKQELLDMRRAVLPVRDSLLSLTRGEYAIIGKDLYPFFRDLLDNLSEVLESIDSSRDMLTGAVEINLAAKSNQMNQVMKVLTIIATIFIPLTFISGLYGMNFVHMPELDEPWAYPLVLVLMLATAAGMIIYFKRKKWF